MRDRLKWYFRLKELNPEWTQADLAKAVHASTADVSKTLTISKRLPTELIDKIGTGAGDLCPASLGIMNQTTNNHTLVFVITIADVSRGYRRSRCQRSGRRPRPG